MNKLDLTKFKACECGNTIESESVKWKDHYSLMGWFWWSMGTTAIPTKVTFTCLDCNKVFEQITSKELIKYYIYYRKH